MEDKLVQAQANSHYKQFEPVLKALTKELTPLPDLAAKTKLKQNKILNLMRKFEKYKLVEAVKVNGVWNYSLDQH